MAIHLFSKTQFSLLVVSIWLYRLLILRPMLLNWEIPENAYTDKQYECNEIKLPGAGKYPSSEAIAFSKKFNLAFVTTGLRYGDFFSHLYDPKYTGVMVIHTNEHDELQGKKSPLFLHFDKVNAHGISIFEKENSVKVAFNSHPRNNQGLEEIVVFEFDVKTETVSNERRFNHPELYSVNDIAFITESSFFATNDHFFPHGHILHKLEPYSTMGLCNLVTFEINETDITSTKELMSRLQFANGVDYNIKSKKVAVAESLGKNVHVADFDENAKMLKNVKVQSLDKAGPDNVHLLDDGSTIGGWMFQGIKFAAFKFTQENIPSAIVKLDENGKYTVLMKDVDGPWADVAILNEAEDLLMGSPIHPLKYCRAV